MPLIDFFFNTSVLIFPKATRMERVKNPGLTSIIFLVNDMPAGLAMCGILFMVAKTTPRANDLFFCGNVYPFLDDAAYLPGYEDDA